MPRQFRFLISFAIILCAGFVFAVTHCASETKCSKDLTGNHLSYVQADDKQRMIVEGAKKNLAEGTEYDLTMGYYVLTYKDGVNTGSKVFPGGDLDPKIGVCTDVIVRSLRYSGIVDLQEAVNKDIKTGMSDYPMSRWGKKKADPNIDHRRVMNLEVWFGKYWQSPGNNDFQPGDIVVWDMNEDGASDHIGIVSDGTVSGRHTVIHNHPDPGHIADEDKIYRWKITGHYRVKDN